MGCWVFIDLRNFVGFTTGGMAKTYLLTLFNLNEGVDKKLKETIDLLFGGEKNSNDNIKYPQDTNKVHLLSIGTVSSLFIIKIYPSGYYILPC